MICKTRWCSPVYNSPSTAKAPPIGKIRPFSIIAVTLEPVMQFGCPLRFKIPKLNCNIVFFITESPIFKPFRMWQHRKYIFTKYQ